MLNVTKELTALARKLGYTGKAPDTVAKAINAITSVTGEGGGSGGGVFIIEVDSDTQTFDKSYKEIKDAYDSGKNCVLELTGAYDDETPYITYTSIIAFIESPPEDTSFYGVSFIKDGNIAMGSTDSENGYPCIVD